jgi:hypothetical protein
LYLLRQLIEHVRLKPTIASVAGELAVLAHRPADWYHYRLPDSMIWGYYVLRIKSLFSRGIGRETQA